MLFKNFEYLSGSGAENNVESAASPVLKPQYKVLKSTRDRRTATDENDNIIDVDVTSSKVKIIEQEFGKAKFLLAHLYFQLFLKLCQFHLFISKFRRLNLMNLNIRK